MKLLLDIGNSTVHWAMAQNNQFANVGTFAYKKNNLQNRLQKNLSSLQKPSHVLVANVGGHDVLDCLDDWVKKTWQRPLWQPCVSANFNALKNSYDDTQQMGIDRWLAMIAAWEKHQSALCLVGCGTALTIDVVDAEGKHLGGYIAPGIELMQQALINKAEHINVAVDKKSSLQYAQNTQAAINNGAFLATVAMIDRVVSDFSNALNSHPECIISGGMATLINPLLQTKFAYEPDLVLSGLLILYRATT